MKRKLIVIISVMLLNFCAALILLTILVEPITLKQSVFTYGLNDTIPTTVADFANGSKKALSDALIFLDKVNVAEVNIYDCEIQYKGIIYPFQIQIRDNNPPIAELVKVKWEIKVGDTLVASEMITNVSESSNYQVWFDGKEPSLEKTFDRPGTYSDVYIYVEDEFGNKSDRLRVSISVGSDQIPPQFDGVDDIAIYLGGYFDPMYGVSALDNLDGDITARINVAGTIDNTTLGIYKLTYTVYDTAGNSTKVVRSVIVTDEYYEPGLVPDVGNGLYLSKVDSQTRFNYYTTIYRSKITSENQNEKVEAIINYLLDNCDVINVEEEGHSTSYSVIVEKVGNSIAFASALKYMCDQLDIPCFYVKGIENSDGRAWNIIQYKNNYYHVDISTSIKNRDKIFLSSAQMKQQGYNYEENKYPNCQETYKEDD